MNTTTPKDTMVIERRRYAALIDTLKTARLALLQSKRRFDCPPYDCYSLAAQIDRAIDDAPLTFTTEARQ